jgi:DNA-binding response OmpR family regulator
MRVLIADDDPVCRRTLTAILSKGGYDVEEARDGLEAWRALQGSDAPRLVILDWMMPGLDGLQLCQRIRRRAERHYVYILMLTARRQRQDILKGLAAGVDDYLTKPVSAQELHVRLRAGRRILDLQERLVAACERLQRCVTDDSAACQQHRNRFLDLFRTQIDFT